MSEDKSSVIVRYLEPVDRQGWEILARGYKDFYMTPTSDNEYETTWVRLMERNSIFGLAAIVDGKLVGIAHYLFHTTVWDPRSCYLQDLFTDPKARGCGIARALIDTVAQHARADGADRFYWSTQENNKLARALYDKLAQYRGFIRYDYPIDSIEK